MQKRDDLLLKNVASFQIFLIVFSIFSFGFLIGETTKVNGQGPKIIIGEFQNGVFRSTASGGIYKAVYSDGKIEYRQASTGQIIKTPPAPGNPPETSGFGKVTLPGGAPIGGSISTYISNLPKGMEIPITGGKVLYENVGGLSAPLADGSKNVIGLDGKTVLGNIPKDQLPQMSADISAAGGKEIGQFSGPLGTSGWFGHIASGLSWALLVVGAIQMVGGLAGWDDSLTDSLSVAAGN